MGSSKVVAAIGGVVVAVVAAGLWLVMGGEETDGGGASQDPHTETAAGQKGADPEVAGKQGRKRTRVAGTAVVSGTVMRRKGGEPAAGQVVSLAAGSESWTAECDAAGAFRFAELPEGGPYQVAVAAPGCARVVVPGIALGKDDQHDVGTLWLDLAARATVTVVDTRDTPVAGALVEAHAFVARQSWDYADPARLAAQVAAAPVPVAKATTDAAGRVVFDELASGTWAFSAAKAGLSSETRGGVRLDGGAADDGVRIVLRPSHPLKGRVVDGEGRPVAGTLVLASRGGNMWDQGATRIRATTSAEGAFAFDTLSAGDWVLLSGLPTTAPAPVLTVRVPSLTEIELRLKSGGRLTGTVTKADDGSAVEGAVVRAIAYGAGTVGVEARTDAAGKFVVEQLPAEQVGTFSVEKAGFVIVRAAESRQNQVFVPRGETADVPLKVAEGGAVAGTVTGPDGPVPGARVQVWSWDPQFGATGSKTATTDATGAFSVSGVEKGRAVVQVSKEGLYQKDYPEQGYWQAFQSSESIPCRVDVAAGAETKLDVRMEAGITATGRVDGPDGPVAGATVTAGGSTSAPTGADGVFKVTGLRPAAQTWFSAQKQDLVAVKHEQVAVSADAPPAEIVLTLAKQPVVRGKVVSATGEPLVDGRVVAALRGDLQGGALWSPHADADTGIGTEAIRADGSFELRLSQATGKFSVRAFALGHAPRDSDVVVVSLDRSEYEANISLDVGSTVTGRVVHAGAGIAGARISLSARAGGGTVTRTSMDGVVSSGVAPGMRRGSAGAAVVAVSGADGMFSVPHVANGRWRVSAALDGYVAGDRETNVPDAAPLTIELAPELAIEGSVVFGDGRPAAGVTVSAQRADQQQAENGIRRGGPAGPGSVTQTSADGRFRVRALPPGEYTLRADRPWGSHVNMRPKVSAAVPAGTTDVKIVVDAGTVISGRVVNSRKEPITGAWVNANPDGPQASPDGDGGGTTQTGPDGAFELTGLGDGTYMLWVGANTPDGQASHRPAQKAKVPAGTTGLEIALEEGLTIDGVLADEAGKPVPNVMLQAAFVNEEGRDSSGGVWVQPVTTGGSGKFRIAGLAPGRYSISTVAWSQNSRSVVVTGGEAVTAGATGVRLTATRGLSISGVVVDESGSPIHGARVMASVRVGQQHASASAQTDAAGKFEVTGLQPGKASVSVNAPGRVSSNQQDVQVGSTGLRFELARALRATGRVSRGGKPVASTSIMFTHPEGKGRVMATTDDEGRFTADGMTPGTWKAVVWIRSDTGQVEQKDAGTITAGETNADLRVE